MGFPRFATELEELRERMALSELADELIEGCLRERLSLRASMDRVLPPLCERLGACGAAVLARDEELNRAAFGWGALGGHDAWTLLDGRAAGAHRMGTVSLVCQELDVAGESVGQAGFVFDAPLDGAEEAARARVRCICEELDAVLATIHVASQKQDLIQRIMRALSDRVFERGLDEAVGLLSKTLELPTCVFVWRDVVAEDALYYRLYRDGRPEHDSEVRRHPGLDAAILEHGVSVLAPDRHRLRAALGLEGCLENVLVSGTSRADWLGKCLVQAGPGGFSPFSIDLLRLLAEAVRERLVDHNRERLHLSQFFPSRVINELLREPSYQDKYLAPRDEIVGLLYADINSFTKISEQVLERPALVAEFVDGWSEGVVDLVWKHGGTFDKMVGDCVIGIFGPPFFRDPPADRALAAIRTAREIQAFTIRYGEAPLLAPYRGRPELERGLGVAIGVNLCPASVGTFGPNRDITAYSSGMNNAARLQGLAGFREILVMEEAVRAIAGLPVAKDLSFGPPAEAPVKNVARPLRFSRLLA